MPMVRTKTAARLLQLASIPCFVAGAAILLSGFGEPSGPGCAGVVFGGFMLVVGVACLYFGGRAARAGRPG